MEELAPFTVWARDRPDRRLIYQATNVLVSAVRDGRKGGLTGTKLEQSIVDVIDRWFAGDPTIEQLWGPIAGADHDVVQRLARAYAHASHRRSIDLSSGNLGVRPGSNGPTFVFYDF